MDVIRIATRESPLALCQSRLVADVLQSARPGLKVELVGMTTEGDRAVADRLPDIGGKAVFIKELEQSMLRQQTRIAVHSMKDVPADMPAGFCIAGMMKRAQPADAFISKRYRSIDDLPAGATLGTSSLRRRCQIYNYRSDINVKPLRGNVGTRLRKLDEGQYDAIVLACAGLQRLGIEQSGAHSHTVLSSDVCLSAIGQGAIGVEARAQDSEMIDLIRTALNDTETEICVNAERTVSRQLGADCRMPLAANAVIESEQIVLNALIVNPETFELLRAGRTGPRDDGERIGQQVAQDLVEQGAGEIIQNLRSRDGL